MAVRFDFVGATLGANTFGGDQLFSPDATYDIGKTGATRPRDGFFSRELFAGSSVTATTYIGWASLSLMRSPSTGVITLLNAAETSFTRLNFGGATTSFVALGASGTLLNVRLADGTAGGAIGSVRYIRYDQSGFAAYPSAAGAGEGSFAYVNDSSTAVVGATVTGGGANKILMISNGTNWKVAASAM